MSDLLTQHSEAEKRLALRAGGCRAVARRFGEALLAATLVLVGGGCVSYRECRTRDGRVLARSEMVVWTSTRLMISNLVPTCFRGIWCGNARKTSRRLNLAEQRRAQEEEETRQQEKERQAREQLERQRKSQEEQERLEQQRQQDEAEKALAKQREEERRKREEERRKREEEKHAHDRKLMLDAMREQQHGVSSDAAICPQKSSETRSDKLEADR